jgi:hypothetical protein
MFDETLTSLEMLLTDEGLPVPSSSPSKTHLIGPLWARIAITVGAVLLAGSGGLLVGIGLIR